MRQVRCIRPRAGIEVGDLAEVGDDAEVSDLYWEHVQEVSSNAGGKSAPGDSEVSSSPPPVLITPDGPRPADTKGAAS